MQWYFVLVLPMAVVLWLLYEWMEHNWIQYKTTYVECQNLSKHRELRICLITDLHNNRKKLERLIQQIGAFSPEVILLAGDLVDKHKPENPQAEKFLAALQTLNVPVFYSAGNHELSLTEKYPQNWELYLKRLPENVCFLDNTSVLFCEEDGICISGLSLPRIYYKKGSLYNSIEDLPDIKLPEYKVHILMAHHPEYAELYEKYRADLIVSGHLHGGLLRLPFIGGVVSPRLCLPKGGDAGLSQLPQHNQLFVSRGLGSHTIPLRFFNRVEVNFLVLKGTKEEK